MSKFLETKKNLFLRRWKWYATSVVWKEKIFCKEKKKKMFKVLQQNEDRWEILKLFLAQFYLESRIGNFSPSTNLFLPTSSSIFFFPPFPLFSCFLFFLTAASCNSFNFFRMYSFFLDLIFILLNEALFGSFIYSLPPSHSRLFQKRLCKNWFLKSNMYLKYFKGF